MKSIELTEKHKSKLLEMCVELFPKSKIQFTDDFYCEWTLFLITEDDYDSTLPENIVECHWFEFCMTHLFNKLIVEKYGYMSISDAMSNGYYVIYSQNPIDYLYNEFLKLK